MEPSVDTHCSERFGWGWANQAHAAPGCTLKVIVLLKGEPSSQSDIQSTLDLVFLCNVPQHGPVSPTPQQHKALSGHWLLGPISNQDLCPSQVSHRLLSFWPGGSNLLLFQNNEGSFAVALPISAPSYPSEGSVGSSVGLLVWFLTVFSAETL